MLMKFVLPVKEHTSTLSVSDGTKQTISDECRDFINTVGLEYLVTLWFTLCQSHQ